ncbi:GNAT family N-acetyltransferase [Denitrificimonas caeni]|uniref:GNAT family N-acetyltransferase n=1 Tax=Denitrificimonas caeni TaxID=521720 RepID=UPI0019669131|nr:GNAT family N-acetyltransferase [Denitrificimonas caeni]
MDQHSTNFSAQCLAENQHTLLRKFYRSHNSPMRMTQQADAWVVRAPSIIAGVCLSPIADGYWLTSLLTAPEHRQQGVASFLIRHLQVAYQHSPIWLFCHPDLRGFYGSLGFRQTQDLPESLSGRLARYQQHKSLIAMAFICHSSLEK